MKQNRPISLKMDPDTYYVWVGGSCDYAHDERAGAGSYIIDYNGGIYDTYTLSDFSTTEFRMMLSVMLHALVTLPENSRIVFMTNVSYIQQNFDKEPTEKSANADLIRQMLPAIERHASVSVKLVPYHKYSRMEETHERSHRAMAELRKK